VLQKCIDLIRNKEETFVCEGSLSTVFGNKTMWRAFFLAVGSTLILLGVQTLVVDHIVVANGTRVPGFVAKFLDRGAVNSGGRLVAPAINANPSLPQQVARVPQVSLQGIGNQGIGNRGIAGTSNATASRFGPSRFSNTPFSNTNLPGNIDYYGGVPFSNRQSPNSSSAQPFSVGPNGSNSQWPSQSVLASYAWPGWIAAFQAR